MNDSRMNDSRTAGSEMSGSGRGGAGRQSLKYYKIAAVLAAVIIVLLIVILVIVSGKNAGGDTGRTVSGVTPYGHGTDSGEDPSQPLEDSISVGAGENIPPASAFLKPGMEGFADSTYYMTAVASIDTSAPGEYPAVISCGGKIYNVKIVVAGGSERETAAPTQIPGPADTVPPVITVPGVREIYAGETVAYRSGLSVSDDSGENVSVEIDSSGVDLRTPGTYKVIYTATDSAGNVSRVESTIIVRDPDELQTEAKKYSEEAMHYKYRRLVAEHLTGEMSDVRKLFTIWEYVMTNIEYVSHSDKSSYVRESIRGLEEGTGDCFTFYSAMKAFMEEAGFETVDVVRKRDDESVSRHYWSLVKVDGRWYHIDATPRSEKRNKYWFAFLRTDSEMLAFGLEEGFNYYYQFDTSLYPATPSEKIADAVMDWDQAVIALKEY